MKRVSAGKKPLVLGIPLLVRLRPIVVQPKTVLIAIHVEHIRIAIRV